MRNRIGKGFNLKLQLSFWRYKKILIKIRIQLTVSSFITTPANGLAEHINRSLVDRVPAMFRNAGMDKKGWDHALLQTAYLQERTINPVLDMKAPLKRCFSRMP